MGRAGQSTGRRGHVGGRGAGERGRSRGRTWEVRRRTVLIVAVSVLLGLTGPAWASIVSPASGAGTLIEFGDETGTPTLEIPFLGTRNG